MSKEVRYVYLVEDSPLQRKMCKNTLMNLGFQVRDYANVEELLPHIQRDPDNFFANAAAVITDFNLSSESYNGGDLTEILRTISEDLIIIGISAASEDEVSGEGALAVFQEKRANRAVNKKELQEDKGCWKRILQEEGIFQRAGVVPKAEGKEDEEMAVSKIAKIPIESFGQEDCSVRKGRSRTFTDVRSFDFSDGEESSNFTPKEHQHSLRNNSNQPRVIFDAVYYEKADGGSSLDHSGDEESKKSHASVGHQGSNKKNEVLEASNQTVRKCCSIAPCSSLVTVVAYIGRGVLSCLGCKRGSMPIVCER